jgi:hypothetical protein
MSSGQFQTQQNIQRPLAAQQVASQSQQQQEAEAARFDNLCKSLTLINSIKDNITVILDNVAKSSQKSRPSQNANDMLPDNFVEQPERAEFIQQTDVKYLQDKAIDLNSKIR